MTYEEIKDNLYQIPGGFGDGGENFGGYLIKDNPSVVIGASGKKFVRNLKEALEDLAIDSFNLYLPNVTVIELMTLDDFQKEFRDVKIHVYKTIKKDLEKPRESFLEKRFLIDKGKAKDFSKKFPKEIKNLVGIDRGDSRKLEKTKLLIIPFPGPHKGHTFFYSTKQRTLFSGIFVSVTPMNSHFYYVDLTSSMKSYLDGLGFIKQASAELHAPSYDQAQLVKSNPVSTRYLESLIEDDVEKIKEILKEARNFDNIVEEYTVETIEDLFYPYNKLNFIQTKVKTLLEYLIEQGQVKISGEKYRLA